MADVAIIDCGIGNLKSVFKAFEHAAPESRIVVTSDAKVVQSAQRVVLPGVGAMAEGMDGLARLGLMDAVLEAAAHKPFMGICLGMQMLFAESEEGPCKGLGLIAGHALHFSRAPNPPRKIPLIGWTEVSWVKSHPLVSELPNPSWFYFVHSYFVLTEDHDAILGESEYGVRFTSAVCKDNIVGVQFHPEKSQETGLRLLANFCTWNP
jgi:glutamine amidotransferase